MLAKVGLVEASGVAISKKSGDLLLEHRPHHLRQLFAFRHWRGKKGENTRLIVSKRTVGGEVCGQRQPLVPPLKKRTRHWCSHGWSGSMARALLTDCSINMDFSEGKERHCDSEGTRAGEPEHLFPPFLK